MSTEIQKMMPFSEMMQMGQVFAESGMFVDTKAAAQAIVKIQAGQEIGIGPFAAMSGIHIIQGKPGMGAGLMASCVKASGKYDYKVVVLDKKICTIDFYQGKEKIGTSTFTAEDAKAAGTKNMDKYPQNMLFARAMSNGAKWYTPDIFAGPVYTPEELGGGLTEDIGHEVILDMKTDTTDEAKEAAEQYYKERVESAIEGLKVPTTLAELADFWKMHKELQKDPAFAAAKDNRKAELTSSSVK